ncbi:MAG: class I SAM-dependent rRNA methyltransferase [Flavobacteriia bacterium]|nr:class I SAM-dependent rRNA methyltransferase [Flavobacteriia bacterium]
MNKIVLKKNKTASLLRRHPWIFTGAVKFQDNSIQDGELVQVLDENLQFLAIGHYQEEGSICVRILSFIQEKIDVKFFQNRVQNALNLRLQLDLLNQNNQVFRLIHGEGDFLPGLIVDYYHGVLVLQCHSYGMYLSINMLVESFKNVLKKNLKAIYLKSNDTLPGSHNIENKYIYQKIECPYLVKENDINYLIDWENGQKTGFFIDQRENRSRLKSLANNKKVLNTFCYTGGFSLAALSGGATLVHSVDSSPKAIEICEQNIQINGFNKNHVAFQQDAIDFVKNIQEEYDIIVLDPPAFAKSLGKRHQAVQAYKRLNSSAIKKIKKGGLLFTFSCSQVVDKYLFQHTILSAAIDCGRDVRILEQLHQPVDHPINIYHKEGEYLKGLILEIQ